MKRKPYQRKTIPTKLRISLLEKSGFACCMCTEPLLDYDIHHIKFVSSGGTNEPENLLPLCPSCHRTFGHRLGNYYDRNQLRFIRDQWEELAKKDKRIVEELRDKRPKVAATIILDSSSTQLALRFGLYRRFIFLANEIRKEIPIRTATDRVIRSQLLVFSGKMAFHMGKSGDYLEPIENAVETLRNSNELIREVKNAQLILSRLYGRLGAVNQKQRLYEESAPYDSGEDSEEWLEWVSRNRKNSFRYYENFHIDLDDRKLTEYNDYESIQRMVNLGSILNEVGVFLYESGKVEEARAIFLKALTLSRFSFHRRGILVRHIRLAEVYITLEMFEDAIEHILLASGFSNVSTSVGINQIRYQLENKLGPDAMRDYMRSYLLGVNKK